MLVLKTLPQARLKAVILQLYVLGVLLCLLLNTVLSCHNLVLRTLNKLDYLILLLSYGSLLQRSVHQHMTPSACSQSHTPRIPCLDPLVRPICQVFFSNTIMCVTLQAIVCLPHHTQSARFVLSQDRRQIHSTWPGYLIG